LFSKMRYLSAQLTALIRNGVAERNASQANEMAARLAEGLSRIPGSRLLDRVDINEIFIFLPEAAAERLKTSGYEIKLRVDGNGPHFRFVTAWNSTAADVDQFVATAAGDKLQVAHR
jgi:threonine aldolase